MGRPIKSGGIIAALLLALSGMPAFGGTPLPFTLTWVKGVCTNCKTASNLSDVQFVASDEAWAIGFMPPGETGAGDYSVLHSRDGGKTWREIPEPWQHNGSPSLSFANAHDGWLKDMDLDRAEDRLLLTHDGGAHWRQLSLHDMFFSNAQYLGDGIGFAVDDNVYTPPSRLLSTRDDGAHWTTSFLPKGFSPERMDFVSDREGVIAGCLDRKAVAAIRTEDSGAHWTSHIFDVPRPAPPEDNCTFEPDSLDFIDANHGWILVSKHSFGLHDRQYSATAWATADGGVSWKPIFHADSQDGYDLFFEGLYFLDDRLGFLWNDKTIRSKQVGMLLYTVDGGRNWSEIRLPQPIWGCHRYQESLDCGVGWDGFSTLRVARAGAP
jgi:photosystem II stability/assembly factor-like uncharacterized protein